MKGIYAIYDTKAQDILGLPHLFAHQAAAVRFFGDVASFPDSQVGKHIEDFELVRLGYFTGPLDAENRGEMIEANYELILKGSTWAAAQQERDNAGA